MPVADALAAKAVETGSSNVILLLFIVADALAAKAVETRLAVFSMDGMMGSQML